MLCLDFLYSSNATKLCPKFLISVTNHILEIHFPVYPIIFEVSPPILVNRYVGMYPRGNKYSTDCLSLYLYLDASDELHLESKKVVLMTLSILDQKNGKHLTGTSGLLVFTGTHRWGWPDFLGLEKLKDPSGGYVVGSSCVVKADLTIVGSSNDG
uniref:MATH domain-containing protein n=1 Tax=Aegilops tauschii subsp. strangulata TaxID=200361 RepID=A0A452YHT1_AEGTS